MQPSGDANVASVAAERVRILWTMAGTRRTRAVTLGAQMRDAREKYAPEMTDRSMCGPLGVKHPTVNRWLSGERKPRPEDVSAFMMLIGAPGDERERLVEMAKETGVRPMTEDQGQYAAMLEIERTARELVHVATALVPGMLQKPEYARAVYVGAGVSPELIDTRVAVRIGRQAALTRHDPLVYRAFIWEPVLHAPLGGDQVMQDQLQHLLDVGQRPNVDIRIIPIRASWNPGWEGPFSVATFPDDLERRPVVQLENKVSALYYDQDVEVAPYLRDAERAGEVAISSEESAELIASVINGKETTR